MCTEECGRTEPPDERELVEAFQVATNDLFAFLQPIHQFCSGRFQTFNLVEGERVPAALSALRFPFLAEIRFQGEGADVVVEYGDREYELTVSVGTDSVGLHPLGSWLEVLGFRDATGTAPWVIGPKSLSRHARDLAAAVKRALPVILETGHEARTRLDGAEFRSESDIGRIRDEARQAFGQGDYERAALLFVEIEELLTSTESRQLEFARQQLVG